jgi:DNA-binding NarL/FixJ family response regulator
MKNIRLLLVEDDRFLRDGIKEILKHQKDIKVVAASGNKENTILKIHKLKPNVVLLDLSLRSKNSLQVVKMVKKEFPDAKVIVMDLAPVPADIAQFVRAGASGFILKDVTVEKFLHTIRAVAEGTKVLPPFLTNSFFSGIVENALKTGHVKLKKQPVKKQQEPQEVIGKSHVNGKLHVNGK